MTAVAMVSIILLNSDMHEVRFLKRTLIDPKCSDEKHSALQELNGAIRTSRKASLLT